MASHYINVGHMGLTGRKVLRNEWKIWKKIREEKGIVEHNDFNSFLLAKYKMKPSIEKEMKEAA